MGAHSKTSQYQNKVSITSKNAPVNNLSITRKTPGGRQSRAMDHSRCGERTIHSCFPGLLARFVKFTGTLFTSYLSERPRDGMRVGLSVVFPKEVCDPPSLLGTNMAVL
jgi:hypothetical protein